MRSSPSDRAGPGDMICRASEGLAGQRTTWVTLSSGNHAGTRQICSGDISRLTGPSSSSIYTGTGAEVSPQLGSLLSFCCQEADASLLLNTASGQIAPQTHTNGHKELGAQDAAKVGQRYPPCTCPAPTLPCWGLGWLLFSCMASAVRCVLHPAPPGSRL